LVSRDSIKKYIIFFRVGLCGLWLKILLGQIHVRGSIWNMILTR
jgi:hypothetical protein